MKRSKLGRVLSPLFDRELACNMHEHDEIKSILQNLKQKAREIIHAYRSKALTLLKECRLRQRKI
jgi:hypothetical protein